MGKRRVQILRILRKAINMKYIKILVIIIGILFLNAFIDISYFSSRQARME